MGLSPQEGFFFWLFGGVLFGKKCTQKCAYQFSSEISNRNINNSMCCNKQDGFHLPTVLVDDINLFIDKIYICARSISTNSNVGIWLMIVIK